MTILPHLQSAFADLQSFADGAALERMAAHWNLLQKWAPRMNLTSIRGAEDAAWKHYRDSVAPIRVLSVGPWVDIGSGAGFPGLPLAIIRPQVLVTLVEPRKKRVSFLRAAIAELGLENVSVREGRSTDGPDKRYAAVVTRATFSEGSALRELTEWCAPGGQVVALRREPSGEGGARIYSYQLRGERRVMEVWAAS